MIRKKCKTCNFSSECENHFEGDFCTNCYFGRIAQLEKENAELKSKFDKIQAQIDSWNDRKQGEFNTLINVELILEDKEVIK